MTHYLLCLTEENSIEIHTHTGRCPRVTSSTNGRQSGYRPRFFFFKCESHFLSFLSLHVSLPLFYPSFLSSSILVTLTMTRQSIPISGAVVHPVASISIRTQKNASTAIILTWITILLTCSPALIAHGEQIYDFHGTHYSQCQFKEEYNKQLYHSIFFLSSYIVPITIVFVLYLLMLNRLWFGAVPGGRMSSESVRSKVITSSSPSIFIHFSSSSFFLS